MSDHLIPIYHFYRAFDHPHYSQAYKRWVSGGYSPNKIAPGNQEVPEPIRQAVINGYFALNDNYPPAAGEFALIAREIDHQYSVLAVANQQRDDGDRPTIGYKYFWLEKTVRDMDGIGTLIYWWKSEYQFDMRELTTNSPQLPDATPELRINFQSSVWKEIQTEIQEVTHIPLAKIATKHKWGEYEEYVKLHYLSDCLSLRASYPNAWAWNVSKLVHPEKFCCIYYSMATDIPSNIYTQELTNEQSELGNNTSDVENHYPNEQQNANILTPPVDKIQRCLTDIARKYASQNKLDTKKAEELFGYIATYPNANWSAFIDQITIKSPTSKLSRVYKAEIYLLLPKEHPSFLIEILKSINIDNDRANPFVLLKSYLPNPANSPEDETSNIAIDFQNQLLNANHGGNPLVTKRLVSSIYIGISYLLSDLKPLNIQNNQINSQIKYLLVHSNSVWSKYFRTYADLAQKIIFPEQEPQATITEESVQAFCQEILNLLKNPQNTTLAKRKHYKNLASIFREIKYYPLAGACYYISDKLIPQDILEFIGKNDRILKQIYNTSNTNIAQPSRPGRNDISPRDDRYTFIWFTFFLLSSGIFKTLKNIIIPNNLIFLIPQLTLFVAAVIYSIMTILVIIFTGDYFFFRKNNRFSRIIGSFLVTFYMAIFILIMYGNNLPRFTPISINIFPSQRNQCQKDLLANFDQYTRCFKPLDDREKIQEIRKILLPQAEYNEQQAQLVIQYLSKSKDENNFSNLKDDVKRCQNNPPAKFKQCLNNISPIDHTSQASSSIDCSNDLLNSLQIFQQCNESDQEELKVYLRNLYRGISSFNAEPLRQYYLNSNDDREFQDKKQQIDNCKNNTQDPNNFNSCLEDKIQKSNNNSNQESSSDQP
ncbi:MAG TPA: hypothetical protein VK184_21815 [Nostocaceae cyanobacterium]|nr:hypothetical protein [Nostocaceae cyanobacterium]